MNRDHPLDRVAEGISPHEAELGKSRWGQAWRGIVASLLAISIAAPALAQQPDTAALGQEVMECIGAKIQLRTKINQLEVDLAKAKAPPPDQPPK